MCKNCPNALNWKFHNSKDGKIATISFKAWCDRDLYVWRWFTGGAGTKKDLTLAHEHSPLFKDILYGSFPFLLSSAFKIIGSENECGIPLFLVDGIYANRFIFDKPISHPTSEGGSTYTRRR